MFFGPIRFYVLILESPRVNPNQDGKPPFNTTGGQHYNAIYYIEAAVIHVIRSFEIEQNMLSFLDDAMRLEVFQIHYYHSHRNIVSFKVNI